MRRFGSKRSTGSPGAAVAMAERAPRWSQNRAVRASVVRPEWIPTMPLGHGFAWYFRVVEWGPVGSDTPAMAGRWPRVADRVPGGSRTIGLSIAGLVATATLIAAAILAS